MPKGAEIKNGHCLNVSFTAHRRGMGINTETDVAFSFYFKIEFCNRFLLNRDEADNWR